MIRNRAYAGQSSLPGSFAYPADLWANGAVAQEVAASSPAGRTERKGGEGTLSGFLMQTYTIILPILLGYIVWLLKRQKRDRDANSKGTMLLLRVQLIEYHTKWMERGYVTKHGLENFMEMYNAYHQLGGNGMVTELLNEVRALPIKD